MGVINVIFGRNLSVKVFFLADKHGNDMVHGEWMFVANGVETLLLFMMDR